MKLFTSRVRFGPIFCIALISRRLKYHYARNQRQMPRILCNTDLSLLRRRPSIQSIEVFKSFSTFMRSMAKGLDLLTSSPLKPPSGCLTILLILLSSSHRMGMQSFTSKNTHAVWPYYCRFCKGTFKNSEIQANKKISTLCIVP